MLTQLSRMSCIFRQNVGWALVGAITFCFSREAKKLGFFVHYLAEGFSDAKLLPILSSL